MPDYFGVSTFLLALLGALIGSAICWAIERWWYYKQMPYRWVCPEEDCIFSCRGTDPVIIAQMAGRHEKGHQDD